MTKKTNPVKSEMAKAISVAFPKESICASDGSHEVKRNLAPLVVLDEGASEKISISFHEDWNILEIKKSIAEYSVQGKIGQDVLDVVSENGLCAPVEFDLLDYKEQFDVTAYGKAKLVLNIVSFYNSYGGYLIFGVKEAESETRFEIVGVDESSFDVESIKAKIKEFTGERVQISVSLLTSNSIDGDSVKVFIVYIPKRPVHVPPLTFVKDGPCGDNRKNVFTKDQIYYRNSDECIEAKGHKILELNGDRLTPHIEKESSLFSAPFRINRIQHDLPDRNFICPKFVGRDLIIDSLWRWLSDDLSHVKVIAGEGGLGKSSIAYEFAERVSEFPNIPFEQIVWLTAKKQQFKAFDNSYVNVPERHYSSYGELLLAICQRLPFSSDELNGVADATVIELRRMIKKGLSDYSSLIIIDDVDSLPSEEQKQVLEIGMILGSSTSRILLTTRFNQSYSLDNVIKISGLPLEKDFPEYLLALAERFELQKFKQKDIEKIHAASGGSPLFAESILRLLKWNSISVNESIAQWKGERGTEVRAAALKREIELLTSESQRVFLAIAMLGEASTIELCEALGYTMDSIETALNQLQSLFLVAAPALASIPRFRVPENTRRLLRETSFDLVTDRVRLEREIEKFKQGNSHSTKDIRVASAISQANILQRSGDLKNALLTIKDARRKTKDHYDLLSYQASLHLKENPSNYDEARKLCRSAFSKGCRKAELFDCWFSSEWQAKNYIGALEASEAAISNNAPGMQDWLIKKSVALDSKARDQANAGSISGAISTMFEASESLMLAISRCSRDEVGDIEKSQFNLHDQIWIWTGIETNILNKSVSQIDNLDRMWKLNDTRITNIRRILSAIESLINYIDRRLERLTGPQKNLCYSLFKRAGGLIDRRLQRFPLDSRHEKINNNWLVLTSRAEDVISHKTYSITENY